MATRRAWAVAFFVCAVSARAQARKLLAVLPLNVANTNGRMTKADEASLEEMLRGIAGQALRGTEWQVITSETEYQLLEDNHIDPSKCSEAHCVLTAARQIEVDDYISGQVQFVDGVYTASIRLESTKTGELLADAEITGATTMDLRRAFQAQAASFFAQAGIAGRSPAATSTIEIGGGPALQPVPSLSSSFQSSALEIDASTEALVARDAALKADANGRSDPDAATLAWQNLAAITEQNPYRQDALARAAKWREYAQVKDARDAREADDKRRIEQILPLTSIDKATKEKMVDRFAQAYGDEAAKPLRKEIDPSVFGIGAELGISYLAGEHRVGPRWGLYYAGVGDFDRRWGYDFRLLMFMTHEGGINYPTDESSGLLYDFLGFGYDLRMRPAVRLPLYVGLGAEAAWLYNFAGLGSGDLDLRGVLSCGYQTGSWYPYVRLAVGGLIPDGLVEVTTVAGVMWLFH